MNNIEKYKETKDALEAWRQSVEGGVYLSFDEWAQREYEATRAPTLLEAEARFERWLDRVWNAVLVLCALAFIALAWWGTR